MPRILTNKFGLPKTLVKAVQYDTHRTHGTISCTELIDGPRIRILKRLHSYESDVSENIYALMGTALHHVLERANIDSIRKRAFILTAETIMLKANEVSKEDLDKGKKLVAAANYIFGLIPLFFPEMEEEFIFEKTLQLELKGDHVLSMTFDLYEIKTGILYDYKLCSVYQYMFPDAREKWNQQTNVYAYGLHHHGYKINGIRIVAFFRDFNEMAGLRNRDYPERQIMEIPVPLGNPNSSEPWYDQVKRFIDKRIDLHIQAESGNIPDCTGKDRWAKSDVYAVKMTGRKKAEKLFESMVAAERFISENYHRYPKKLFIEVRPGSSMRCEKYCPVKKFCSQYAEEKAKEKALDDSLGAIE